MANAQLRCVILAAGMGTRLGLPEPKPLALLDSSTTILDRQLSLIRGQFGTDLDITLVLGHLAEQFDFLGDSVSRVLNPRFATTNTSKSLLLALEQVGPGPVLWMNGDVVFKPRALDTCVQPIAHGSSFMVVDEGPTGEEEVKYCVRNGSISEVGKAVSNALGEAIGMNHVAASERQALVHHLRQTADSDYFETAIQSSILAGSILWQTARIDRGDAIEVDTVSDLLVAQDRVGHGLHGE